MASLNGVMIPTTIDGHGRYLYRAEVIGTNGEGEAIVSNYAAITWTFEAMALSDFEWICDTLMGGEQSARFSSGSNPLYENSLYDDHGDEIIPNNVVVMRPTYEYASGGYAYNVSWILERVR